MNQEQQIDSIGKIIARAWSDAAFKQALLSDTGAVLRAEGFALPEGVEVVALENTDKVFNLVIPAAPAEGELSEVELESVSGGFFNWGAFGLVQGSGGLMVGGIGLSFSLAAQKAKNNKSGR